MIKKIVVLLAISLLILQAKADQLAYLSKDQADQALAAIEELDYLYLFCGCCDDDPKLLIKVLKAEVVHTGYMDYYEVKLTYQDSNGDTTTKGIDLAYVWTYSAEKEGPETIGELLQFEHDPCQRLGEVVWE